MLKIYGSDLSAPANKVRFVANALNLEYEYIRVNLREGENKTEEYLKINPTGKIPAINEDGFCLFESNAIVKYLVAKNNSDLYPQDLKSRAIVDQWIDFSSIHVGTAMGKVLYNRVFATLVGAAVDERSLQDGLRFLERFLPVIEQQLSKTQYICGDQMNLADICLLATLDPAEVAGVDILPYNKITLWRNELKQKSFYQKCYKNYGEQLTRIKEKST